MDEKNPIIRKNKNKFEMFYNFRALNNTHIQLIVQGNTDPIEIRHDSEIG